MDDLRPEHAGKMNFYLSAVDDLLRHPTDAPTIGIILCQHNNAVVVEYALRDMSKPMGVAKYRLSAQLPPALQTALPTAADLEGGLPLLSLSRLGLEIEQTLRARLERLVGASPRGSIRELIVEIEQAGGELAHGWALLEQLPLLHAVLHGREVTSDDTARMADTAAKLLAELRAAGIDAVHVHGDARVLPDRDGRRDLVVDLFVRMEPPGSQWRPEQVGPYIDRLVDGIVGFEIEISRLEAQLRLGQGNTRADLDCLQAALDAGTPRQAQMGALMRRISSNDA